MSVYSSDYTGPELDQAVTKVLDSGVTAPELGVLNAVTPGLAAASKALTLNSSKGVTGLTSIETETLESSNDLFPVLVSAPSAPASGKVVMYNRGGKFYYLDSSGVETQLGPATRLLTEVTGNQSAEKVLDSIVSAANTFKLLGDYTDHIVAGSVIEIKNSPNDTFYSVASVTLNAGKTEVVTVETVPGTTTFGDMKYGRKIVTDTSVLNVSEVGVYVVDGSGVSKQASVEATISSTQVIVHFKTPSVYPTFIIKVLSKI